MQFDVNIVGEELLKCIVVLYVISRKRYDSKELFNVEAIVRKLRMSSTIGMRPL